MHQALDLLLLRKNSPSCDQAPADARLESGVGPSACLLCKVAINTAASACAVPHWEVALEVLHALRPVCVIATQGFSCLIQVQSAARHFEATDPGGMANSTMCRCVRFQNLATGHRCCGLCFCGSRSALSGGCCDVSLC